jgi:para-nitrobenzyl esterase
MMPDVFRTWPAAIAALALAALFAPLATAQPAGPASVRTADGLLQGVRQGDVIIYKGVPFGAPPVGELRWKAPAPVQPWTGVRKADVFGPGCLQPEPPANSPGRGGTYSEDCLYLNVWRPAEAMGPLPVMVWIYGGGFTGGSAAWDLFDASNLARHGVMVVTFNYRVGALGFLAHPDLTRESPHHASGNYGYMDAIAALRWIRRNAAALGGDPSRVTLFGQSAGGIMISDLQVSPEARGLFHRVIGESTGDLYPVGTPPGPKTLADVEHLGADYAKGLGAPTLEALRKLPATAFTSGPPWARPIVDGWILPTDANRAFSEGRQIDVPTLVGTNAQEANFPVPLPSITAVEVRKNWETYFKPHLAALEAAYPFTTDAEASQARLEFVGDINMRWTIWTWAALQSRSGKAPAFVYHFEQPEPLKDVALSKALGAPHASELFFIFQDDRMAGWDWKPADRALAEQMAGYWTNFAKRGDPNGPGLPAWPRFSASDPKVMRLKVGPEAETEPLGARMDLLTQLVHDIK